MRRSGPWLLAGLTLVGTLASACSDDDDDRVALDDLIDPEFEIPDGATGIEIDDEEMKAVTEARSFCSVAGELPLRWFDDAIIPVQISVDAYSRAQDVPAEAAEPIERLVQHGEALLRWNLGGGGDRPEFGDDLQADVVIVSDAALAHCPDLPLVIGPPGSSAAPAGWADMSEGELAAHCDDMRGNLESDLAEYEEIVGEPATHSIQLDAVLPYSASDWFGIVHDQQEGFTVVAVPGGGCDLE